tara:strand:+ start:35238 stop:36623 length:1386 start_codon:yes stop_codon:yes gene_type:complete
MNSTSFPALAAVLMLASCASLPAIPQSEMARQTDLPLVSASDAAFDTGEPEGQWWHLYQDARLDALIAQALDENRSIAEAAAAYDQVRASLRLAGADRLPGSTVSGSAGYVRNPTAAGIVESDSYSAGFQTAYEIDLFGRVNASMMAAEQDVLAAEAAYDTVRLGVVAETARAWADYCAGNAQLTVAGRNVEVQARVLELTQSLMDAGRGLRLDVVRAESALESARASVPSVRAARDAAIFRLATLTGQAPAAMRSDLPECVEVPALDSRIAVGDLAGLIARRPDVRQAERNLAASTARIGIATAALYPTISVAGSLSTSALDPSDLGASSSISYSVGPLLSWSFPNVTAARARIAQAEAGSQIALARFDQSILTAIEETENALTGYVTARESRDSLVAARRAAQEASRLARLRYEAGADDFLPVLDAERTLADAETAVSRADAAVAGAEIAVFKALGGSW